MKFEKSGLILLLALINGCASWRMEPVALRTEVESTPRVEVSHPRVYQDARGYLVAGSLRVRGPGAHTAPSGHLHGQLVDARGLVTEEVVTSAPQMRHNRHRPRESATYILRMTNLPPQGGRLRIILHQPMEHDHLHSHDERHPHPEAVHNPPGEPPYSPSPP